MGETISKTKRRIFKAISLAMFGLISLITCELTARHSIREGGSFNNHTYPSIFLPDKELGWRLRPNVENARYNQETISTDGKGRRIDRRLESRVNSPTIGFFGDSFTFGLEVNDNETFSSFLSQITGDNVINYGVPAYGLDQMILSLEKNVGGLDKIIISIIPHDLIRTKLKKFGGIPKPYFTINKDKLIKSNPENLGLFYSFSSYLNRNFALMRGVTMLGDIIRQYFPSRPDNNRELNVKQEYYGAEVKEICTKLIEQNLGEINKNVPIIFQVIPQRSDNQDYSKLIGYILASANKSGITSINLMNDSQFKEDIMWRHGGHLSPQGNEYVAERLAGFL